MSSLETFVIADVDDINDIKDAQVDGKTLDPYDFSIHGYAVDESKYPMVGKMLLKGKARIRDEEGEANEDEDASGDADTPSTSEFEFDQEESEAEGSTLDTLYGEEGSASLDPELEFPNLNINE